MLERDFRFCTGNLLLINIISCDKNKFSNRPNWWPQCLTPRTSHGSTLDARLCLSSTIKNIILRPILSQQVCFLYMVKIFFFRHYLQDTTLKDQYWLFASVIRDQNNLEKLRFYRFWQSAIFQVFVQNFGFSFFV